MKREQLEHLLRASATLAGEVPHALVACDRRILLAMAILVDQAIWPWRGRRWAHLVSDESYDELHDFAARLGIPRRAFQGDHYDLPTEYRDRAITLGAEAVDARILVRRLRAAGLRRPHRPS